MRDDDLRRSNNIEDRRGDNSGGFGGGGGRGGFPIKTGGGLGFIILLILYFFFGGGSGLLDNTSSNSNQGFQPNAQTASPSEDKQTDRVAAVLGSTEDYWAKYFSNEGAQYPQPVLVIFNNRTSSPCGTASGATGPFYCPADEKVYLDLSFFRELEQSLGARGDFAQAYVIAHEVGHHVQNAIGILPKAHKAMARGGDKGEDSIAVRLELQADCYAGMWAKGAIAETGALEQGDIEEAIGAAMAVGDDRLQKNAQGYAVPESFTHGTSEQRARWFAVGMQYGSLDKCNTFNVKEL